MKRISFTSVEFSATSFNIAMLILRISFGVILMVKHGFAKVMDFNNLQHTFYNFLGFGPKLSLNTCLVCRNILQPFYSVGLIHPLGLYPYYIYNAGYYLWCRCG